MRRQQHRGDQKARPTEQRQLMLRIPARGKWQVAVVVSAAPIDRRYCICAEVAIANVARTQQSATGFHPLRPKHSIPIRTWSPPCKLSRQLLNRECILNIERFNLFWLEIVRGLGCSGILITYSN